MAVVRPLRIMSLNVNHPESSITLNSFTDTSLHDSAEGSSLNPAKHLELQNKDELLSPDRIHEQKKTKYSRVTLSVISAATCSSLGGEHVAAEHLAVFFPPYHRQRHRHHP